MISEAKCYLSTTIVHFRKYRRLRRRKEAHFHIPLILDKYNITSVMQKLKFMQEFTSAISVECLHGSLQAN